MKKILALVLLTISSVSFAALTETDRAILDSKRNILENPGFENGRAAWNASAGVSAANSASRAFGSLGYSWNASATTQNLTSSLVTIPEGLKGNNATSYCYFKAASGTATHKLQVWNGSSSIAETNIISSTTAFVKSFVNFTAPTSGSLAIRILSQADEPEIYIDECFLGFSDSLNINQTAWVVDATISGANPSLGTSSVSSYTEITDSGLTLTNNTVPGGIAARIPCSSTNSPTGTTCSSGNESVGINFNLPVAGLVRACVSFTHSINSAPSGAVYAAFQVVETPSNAQTITSEGNARTSSTMDQNGGSSAAQLHAFPFRLCGTFNFTTAGDKTLRLMYEQSISGTVNASTIAGDEAATIGQRNIKWEVFPVNQLMPSPVLIGSVTSNSSTAERIERATVAEGAICSASPCTIARQSGFWLSSVSRSGTGAYTFNIASGIFSGPVSCVTQQTNAFVCRSSGVAPTSTSYSIDCRNSSGGLDDFRDLSIICMGPR
jgi:hypothetical protein